MASADWVQTNGLGLALCSARTDEFDVAVALHAPANDGAVEHAECGE
jgi:hypothetical protein